MANRKQLKGVKKGRHNSRAGKRRRGNCKKTVAEKRTLRQDSLLNENLCFRENLKEKPNLGAI